MRVGYTDRLVGASGRLVDTSARRPPPLRRSVVDAVEEQCEGALGLGAEGDLGARRKSFLRIARTTSADPVEAARTD